MNLTHHKVIGTLPSSLEPNSVYYVRVGSGFDMYVTNDAGLVVAYPINTLATQNRQQEISRIIGLDLPLGTNLNSPNTLLNFTSIREDSGWSLDTVNNTITFTGEPDRVNFQAFYHCQVFTSAQRTVPKVILQKNISGTWTDITTCVTYIRGQSGATTGTIIINHVDVIPGINPEYRFLSEQDSNTGGNCPLQLSSTTAKAVVLEDIVVLV